MQIFSEIFEKNFRIQGFSKVLSLIVKKKKM